MMLLEIVTIPSLLSTSNENHKVQSIKVAIYPNLRNGFLADEL